MGTGVNKLVNVVSSSFTSEQVTVPSSVADNQDIVREILTRLPMKSVARFRCVSKEWFAFLNQIRPSCLIYTHSTVEIGYHHHEFSLVRDGKTLSRVESPEIILDGSFKSIYIAGSSNGLVCLELLEDKTRRERIIVWNPVTKQHTQLPKPLCFEGENIQTLYEPLLGFICIQGHGMDIDYKVVRISRSNNRRLVTQVFSRSAKSWRVIKHTDLYCSMIFRPCSVVLNGALLYFMSWNSTKGGNAGDGWSLCSFNLHDEVFHNTPIPSSEIIDQRLDSSSVSSVALRELIFSSSVSSVALRDIIAWSDLFATYSKRRDGDSQQYDVWVMTSNWKWTKQAITMKPPADGYYYEKPYGVWDSLVILDKWLRTPRGVESEQYLCTYDLRNQNETMLIGPEAGKFSKSWFRRRQVVSFMESQVSV